MARINPDPYVGGHLFVLVNRVTCLVDTEDEVNSLTRALEQNGFPPEDIEVFTGSEGAACLDLPGRAHGMVVRLLRTLEAAVGNEGETNHRIDGALRQGGSLLCVRIHKRKSDERARACRVLTALHAHDIHYWGPWAFEDHV